MYLVSGIVAKKVAGPAVVLSYTVAGLAALLSGFCYAELGARVPHTTGSAYVYSYVTVGEFVAFVIGWNMILEYIIGTASCACALSACIDILSNSAISNITAAWAGEVWESPPDILAFFITLAMMVVFFEGVQKSVLFNNVLNIANLVSLTIIFGVGLWFTRSSNWSPFMPMGWSGVFKGAATCFYAFIGFDIIATTGEEAKNPRKSIPIAIITTLILVMFAYISCSAIMTLMVPYKQLNDKAALVQIWGQIGYPSVQWLVSIGALAALTVSMFGSMFPMPRIAYAMAKDGLIFRFLAKVNSKGVPAWANLWLGVISGLCALIFPLEVLVEMMSIGTLLAYTLVDACVLILRYQPNSNPNHPAFIEVFRKDEEAPLKTMTDDSTTKEEQENASCLGNIWRLVVGTHEYQEIPDGQANSETGALVTKVFCSLLVFIVIFDVVLVTVDEVGSPATVAFIFVFTLIIVAHLVAISKFPQLRFVVCSSLKGNFDFCLLVVHYFWFYFLGIKDFKLQESLLFPLSGSW